MCRCHVAPCSDSDAVKVSDRQTEALCKAEICGCIKKIECSDSLFGQTLGRACLKSLMPLVALPGSGIAGCRVTFRTEAFVYRASGRSPT